MSEQLELFTPEEAADYLRLKTKTLANWRSSHQGPDYIKINGSILYRESDLRAFITANVVHVQSR